MALGTEENITVIRRMWDAYRNRGLDAVLEFAAEDAEWVPYSAQGRRFQTTADYRRHVEDSRRTGEDVEAVCADVWGEDDWVVVRGRLRVRGRGIIRDAPMHWVHRLRDDRIVFTSSSPDLGEALREAG